MTNDKIQMTNSGFPQVASTLHYWPSTEPAGMVLREGTSGPNFDLEERTAQFGEAVISFARKVNKDAIDSVLVRQIVRSGTSIGANYCEADNAYSRKEFRQKISTCQKEARETRFWLRMIARACPAEHLEEARKLWREANELQLIFSSILRKTSVAVFFLVGLLNYGSLPLHL